jgi:membrane associated rhomboid family serine protease
MPLGGNSAYNGKGIFQAFRPDSPFAKQTTLFGQEWLTHLMGIYDRDYERNRGYGGSPGYHVSRPQTITVKLMLITGAVYLAQLFAGPWFSALFALGDDWYRAPWQAYQLLSYGFLHDPQNLLHILLNMYGLWLFGREVEERRGPREFLAFYLAAIIVAGLVWSLSEIPFEQRKSMLGASGGVSAVMVLFALYYPHRTILLMFVFPLPMWALAVLIVGTDAMSAVGRSGSVAYTAHLGGALFAFAYYRFGWQLSRWFPTRWKLPNIRLSRRPPLRVHDPWEGVEESPESEIDDILRKIGEHGQESLTRRERSILEQASKDYQKRRK